MMKKKPVDPLNKDCAYCGTSGAKLTCGQCKAAHYCSKACQKQHWSNGHKQRCIPVDKRRPQAQARSETIGDTSRLAGFNPVDGSADPENGGREESGPPERTECPICLELVSGEALCTLPCKHDFHRECVKEIRKLGVLQACPLCRAPLPDGPDKLFDESVRMYVSLLRKVGNKSASWRTLDAPDQINMAEVKDKMTTAANQGHADAQQSLGILYHTGLGVDEDFKEAFQWFWKAANQGHIDAQFSLSCMFRDGNGVGQDYKEAVRWCRKAVDQQHSDAQFHLSCAYISGQGVTPNPKEAAKWCLKAADQGHNAQFNLGVFFENGNGVARDLEQAMQWTRRAADQGHVEAQYNLSTMYLVGDGVVQDDIEAARWTRKAAEQGHGNAQCNLGVIFRNGRGVDQDCEEALNWSLKAADQGVVEAQYNAGTMLLGIGGAGFPKNKTEGIRYIGLAAEEGHLKAQEFLTTALKAAAARGDPGARAKLATLLRVQAANATTAPTSTPPPSISDVPQCKVCQRQGGGSLKLKPCPRCKSSLYCGKDCQRAHWRAGHKDTCRPVL